MFTISGISRRPGSSTTAEWRDRMERDWLNTPDSGPGRWRVGFELGQGFLASMIARVPITRRWRAEEPSIQ